MMMGNGWGMMGVGGPNPEQAFVAAASSPAMVEKFDEAVKSNAVWAYCQMLVCVSELIAWVSSWAEGCWCHDDEHLNNATYYHRRRSIDGSTKSAFGPSPWKRAVKVCRVRCRSIRVASGTYTFVNRCVQLMLLPRPTGGRRRRPRRSNNENSNCKMGRLAKIGTPLANIELAHCNC